MKVATVMLLLSLALSCSTRVTKKERDPIEEHGLGHELGTHDQWWERVLESIQENPGMEVYSKSPKDQLRYAKHAASEGDYDIAIAVYTRLYTNESIDSAIRAESLFLLGKIYSNLLYPYKDFDKAIYFFEKLIAEFADSRLRFDAEQSIDNIQKFMKK